MSITIDLKPEIEIHAKEEATARGLSVKTFLESIIEDNLKINNKRSSYKTGSIQEWEEGLNHFVDDPAFSKSLTHFLDDSRESIYGREDNQL